MMAMMPQQADANLGLGYIGERSLCIFVGICN